LEFSNFEANIIFELCFVTLQHRFNPFLERTAHSIGTIIFTDIRSATDWKILFDFMEPHDIYTREEIKLLRCCTICPRECGVNRFEGHAGYCGTDAGMNIASICVHRGEEPPISGPDGICNIFFSGCNMRCIYCQNHEISRHSGSSAGSSLTGFNQAVKTITSILDKGIKAVGFVSPSHVVPQVKALIRELNRLGYKPVTVYNTNSYDKPETLREIAGMIDVYLPDYKYCTSEISRTCSDAYNYPGIAIKALKEMYYQKGSTLFTDDEGIAVRGMLVRHLVLPGNVEETIKVLGSIAEELSPGVHISIMSQYNPLFVSAGYNSLGRKLHSEEYLRAVEEMTSLGFRNGWLQDPESYDNYLPDFTRDHPFE